MIVIWGSKLYGKVDEIEGVGYVATKFGHLFWIPLIPMGSYFVTEVRSHDFEGTPIGLSMKSVLAGYARVAAILFFLGGLGAANTLFNPSEVVNHENILRLKITICLGILSVPIFIASHLPSVYQASYQTACQLAHTANLDERLRVYIEFCYGKMSEEEAEQRMDSLDTESNAYPDGAPDPELAELYQRYATK